MLLKNSLLIKLKKFVLTKVRFKSHLWNILYFLYTFGMPRLPLISIKEALDFYSRNNKNIFFIEIGANDGVTVDPLRSYIIRDQWSGILVEPVKRVFDLLKFNYRGYQNLIFENVAVADKEEIRPLYVSCYDQSNVRSSLSREIVIDTFTRGCSVEKDLIVEKVQCLTFPKLLEKHGVVKVDLIMIDAEGSDYEIIKTIDFNKIKPSIIIFERNNLSIYDYKGCINILAKNGYRLYKDEIDVIAVKDLDLIKKI